ncbi:hypothetical protein OC25_00280 [Pedobacter kyungheensis]|uniref:Uncharacterized protein n=1 Tax=Pedobacter kyungheensis TaxID=1069985 RepID=A0A0C1FV76_9SPHI|nr:hypothetical protein OC25_00280 [Pedobacter kyungheensis]
MFMPVVGSVLLFYNFAAVQNLPGIQGDLFSLMVSLNDSYRSYFTLCLACKITSLQALSVIRPLVAEYTMLAEDSVIVLPMYFIVPMF